MDRKLSRAEIRSQQRIKVTNEHTLLSLCLGAGGGGPPLPPSPTVTEALHQPLPLQAPRPEPLCYWPGAGGWSDRWPVSRAHLLQAGTPAPRPAPRFFHHPPPSLTPPDTRRRPHIPRTRPHCYAVPSLRDALTPPGPRELGHSRGPAVPRGCLDALCVSQPDFISPPSSCGFPSVTATSPTFAECQLRTWGGAGAGRGTEGCPPHGRSRLGTQEASRAGALGAGAGAGQARGTRRGGAGGVAPMTSRPGLVAVPPSASEPGGARLGDRLPVDSQGLSAARAAMHLTPGVSLPQIKECSSFSSPRKIDQPHSRWVPMSPCGDTGPTGAAGSQKGASSEPGQGEGQGAAVPRPRAPWQEETQRSIRPSPTQGSWGPKLEAGL